MPRVLILAADDFEDMELLYPLYRLREEEVDVTVASLGGSPVTGKKGHGPVAVDAATDDVEAAAARPLALSRSTEEEKQACLDRLRRFQADHAEDRPAALEKLRRAALAGDNLFAVLMDAVRVCSLGEITGALFEVGGRYRRNV
jgi:methylmalonyl-CoA mutase